MVEIADRVLGGLLLVLMFFWVTGAWEPIMNACH